MTWFDIRLNVTLSLDSRSAMFASVMINLRTLRLHRLWQDHPAAPILSDLKGSAPLLFHTFHSSNFPSPWHNDLLNPWAILAALLEEFHSITIRKKWKEGSSARSYFLPLHNAPPYIQFSTKTEKYFDYLTKFLAGEISKAQFDAQITSLLSDGQSTWELRI